MFPQTLPHCWGGGTWTRIAQGRTLVGLDENDSDFNSSEKTGGEKSHQLTTDELPNHTHPFELPICTNWAGNGGLAYQLTNSKTSSIYGKYIGYTGKDQAHNNLQPYYVTYIWKRTA